MVISTRRRRDEMTRMSLSGSSMNVMALAELFEVSPSTVRRDLARLEADGHVARTYGGAVPVGARTEPDLRQRLGEEHEAKLAIGKWAATRIAAGNSVVLDVGTTVAALAHEVRHHPHLTVTTNSLVVMQELSRSEQITVNVLGGTFRPKSQGFVGPLTQLAVESMTFDSAFLGADSVHAELGICEADPVQTVLKASIAARSRSVYVLAHAEKLGRRPFHAWARLPLPWTLVTDADDELTAPFTALGVQVVRVTGPSAEGPRGGGDD